MGRKHQFQMPEWTTLQSPLAKSMRPGEMPAIVSRTQEAACPLSAPFRLRVPETIDAPTPQKLPNFFHTLSTRATLSRPSVLNGWPGLTEPGPAGGGEFRLAGAVPAGRKLAKLNPGQRGGLPDRGGSGRGHLQREWPERSGGLRVALRRRLIRSPARAGCPPGPAASPQTPA